MKGDVGGGGMPYDECQVMQRNTTTCTKRPARRRKKKKTFVACLHSPTAEFKKTNLHEIGVCSRDGVQTFGDNFYVTFINETLSSQF